MARKNSGKQLKINLPIKTGPLKDSFHLSLVPIKTNNSLEQIKKQIKNPIFVQTYETREVYKIYLDNGELFAQKFDPQTETFATAEKELVTQILWDSKKVPNPLAKQRVSRFKDSFYTPEEIAQMLKVEIDTVRRWVRAGKLPAIKLSGHYIRVEKAALKLFLESQKYQKGN